MEKTVVGAGVDEESPVVNISVVPGSVFVIGPILVTWEVLCVVEVEEGVVVVFENTGCEIKVVV